MNDPVSGDGDAAAEPTLPPKTRLDRLVTFRERSEESALETLARAQSSRDRASRTLAGLRQQSREDEREKATAELWVMEEVAHLRTLRQVARAETDLAAALRKEQTARAGYSAAHRNAEVARKAQDKKRAELVAEHEKRERKALDELATLRFNARR
jgi:flagellar export protein FliJ